MPPHAYVLTTDSYMQEGLEKSSLPTSPLSPFLFSPLSHPSILYHGMIQNNSPNSSLDFSASRHVRISLFLINYLVSNILQWHKNG